MLKQYFADGLIQIAIVLSLLRTDLNDYINLNYVNYPEVQEIILGQTAAYTQTNFHNSYNTHLGSPEIYRKNIDSLSLPTVYREIRSFRHFSQRPRRLNIPTFLLVESGTSGFERSVHTAESSSSTQHTENEDENNNNIDTDSSGNLNSISSEDLELEQGQNLLNTLEEAIAPLLNNLNGPEGTDPTMEDLDLIEVLWRQDIDLGVGKEVYDPNLRRELEREREIELQKERQKQKEQELLQAKAEEQRRHAEQRWLADNFTQDGETGEWIPLGGNRVPPPSNDGEQYLQNYNEMPMQEPNPGFGAPPTGNHLPPPYQSPPQPIHPHSSQMYNPNMGQFGNHGNPAGFPQVSRTPCNMTTMNNTNNGYLHPQSQYNNSQYTHTQQNYPQQQLQHHNPQSHHQHNQQQHHHQQHQHQRQQQQQNFPRQQSLDAAWQDLVNILELPSNQTVDSSQPAQVGNMMVNNSVSQLDNTSSVLLQNASMPTPAPASENVTFSNAGMVPVTQTPHRSPPPSSGLMSPNQAFNSSIPGSSNLNPVEWDPCENFLFPNISQSEGIEDVDELLPDLITDEELDNIKFGEIDLSDDVTSPTSRGFSDDGSNESVMSVGSQSIGSPEQNDFSDGAHSPFDGMLGATGGHDSPCPKVFKDDPDDYKYSRSCSYSGGDSNSSNFSSSSNDSHGGGPYSNGHGGGHFSPTGNGHISHNHTYPLKPGQDPKDFKRSKKGKGPQSKDGKRIMELKVPFTMDQIVDSPVEEFNDLLTRHKLTDQQLQLVRDIRRRGKNKVAAQNCRKRKLYVLENLEDEMTTLEKMRDKLRQERYLIDKQTREMKDKLGNLYSEIFHSLRDEHGRPYDPARFSLQQSSDGDVFLVPRNYTTEEDIKKKRHEDRKYE